MESIEVGTEIRVPPSEAFEFLLDFPGYARYSERLQSVELVERADRAGSGEDVGTADTDGQTRAVDAESRTGSVDAGAGDTYALTFAWWKLTHTVYSRVTDVDPPNEIGWTVLGDLDASGQWTVESADEGSRVSLTIAYDADSADAGLVDLPVLVSMDWVVDRAADIALEEGKRVVERVVADLEGEPRPVDLVVKEGYSSP